MKKRIFALALALCMMLSVMPTASANGILTVDNGSNSTNGILSLDNGSGSTPNGVLTLDNGTSGSTTPAPTTQPRQNGVLYNTGSGDQGGTTPADDPIVPVLDEPKATDTENLGEGSDSYRGPALDEKDYTLSKTASKVGAANASTSVKVANDKVTLTKSVSGPDANGHYTITLGASTESETVTVKSAANIVLVLDASQSMVADADTLNSAVDKFLLGASSSKDSKVAIISYSNEAVARTNNTADGTAFLPISVNDSLNSALTTAVDDVTSATKATAGTRNVAKLADKGLEKAVDVIHAYNAVYPDDKNPVVVVLFTDGVPTKDVTVTNWFYVWNQEYDA